MKLKPIIRRALRKAWNILGTDMLRPVTYRRIVRGNYNITTGAVPQTVTTKSLKVAFGSLREILTGVREATDGFRGEQVITALADDLGFKPQAGDQIVEADGTVWLVEIVAGEPDIAWEMSVRK